MHNRIKFKMSYKITKIKQNHIINRKMINNYQKQCNVNLHLKMQIALITKKQKINYK
jgi:hypothetical protein